MWSNLHSEYTYNFRKTIGAALITVFLYKVFMKCERMAYNEDYACLNCVLKQCPESEK